MDQDKSKSELIGEVVDLREQITILKLSEIQRKKAEDALRLSEELNRAILSSLVEDIAVLDKNGNVIAVNEAWERHSADSGNPLQTGVVMGTNYLDVCAGAMDDPALLISKAWAGVRSVQLGQSGHYTLEYPAGVDRWFLLHVTPLADERGGLVIAHIDITRRKHAEEEREQMIHELQEANTKIKTLRGLLPICASCKKIRDDRGYWNQIEVYIKLHSEADFSHSICPDCAKRLYPTVYSQRSSKTS